MTHLCAKCMKPLTEAGCLSEEGIKDIKDSIYSAALDGVIAQTSMFCPDCWGRVEEILREITRGERSFRGTAVYH